MTEPKIVDEERIVTEQVGRFLRVRERCYRVSLEMAVVITHDIPFQEDGGMHAPGFR
jgi:hypothetical protein